MNSDTFMDRLLIALGTLSKRAFAKNCKISDGAMHSYLQGKTTPDLETLQRIADVSGYSLAWLASGEGPMKREEKGEGREICAVSNVTPDYGKRVDDRYCYIPLYDVKTAAGNGAVIDREHIIDFLAFKQEWIRVQLGLSPQDLYLIHVDGESMEPTLRPGDMILIDHRTASSLPRDGIYVLRMDDTLLVKRLQRLPGSVVKVTSDNPAYEPFTLDLKQSAGEVGIIGRVIWCGRRM